MRSPTPLHWGPSQPERTSLAAPSSRACSRVHRVPPVRAVPAAVGIELDRSKPPTFTRRRPIQFGHGAAPRWCRRTAPVAPRPPKQQGLGAATCGPQVAQCHGPGPLACGVRNTPPANGQPGFQQSTRTKHPGAGGGASEASGQRPRGTKARPGMSLSRVPPPPHALVVPPHTRRFGNQAPRLRLDAPAVLLQSPA